MAGESQTKFSFCLTTRTTVTTLIIPILRRIVTTAHTPKGRMDGMIVISLTTPNIGRIHFTLTTATMATTAMTHTTVDTGTPLINARTLTTVTIQPDGPNR